MHARSLCEHTDHSEQVEARLAQQVAQVVDGRVGGNMGRKPPLSLHLG